MTIYPLPPSELDDSTLDKNIKAIAQVLCNVHHTHGDIPSIPLNPEYEDGYADWARTCEANYLKLVEMGEELCIEYSYRNKCSCVVGGDYGMDGHWTECNGCNGNGRHPHKLGSVIEWCKGNVPELRGCRGKSACTPDCNPDSCYWDENPTPFPLCIPKKHIIYDNDIYEPTAPFVIEESYRNYYKSKLSKDAKFTRRERPY